MRRINRKDDGWRTRDRLADAGTMSGRSLVDKWTLVWNETNRRAREWGRAHRHNTMNNVSWNALFERVRDELLGVRWATDARREYARLADFGSMGVAI